MNGQERWAPIVGWEGYYEVSDLGRVRSLDRVVTHRRYGDMHLSARIMAQTTTRQGYRTVSLHRNCILTTGRVHVLVLEAFVNPRPDGAEACHNDGDPSNNSLSNLRWDSHSANVLDQIAHGTHCMARRTHCPQGHEYTPANTIRKRPNMNRRHCRACRDAYRQTYWLTHSA